MTEGPILLLLRGIWRRVWPPLAGLSIGLMVAQAVQDRRVTPGPSGPSLARTERITNEDVLVPELEPRGRLVLARSTLPVAPAKPVQTTDSRDNKICIARIDSIPAGVVVTRDGLHLGTTPLADVSLPCGQVTLTFTHPRYLTTQQQVSLSKQGPGQIVAHLVRPTAELQLASSPKGAVFKVNGEPGCTAPCSVSVPRYESLRLEAALPGPSSSAQSRTWRQNVYVSSATMHLEADLGGLASLK